MRLNVVLRDAFAFCIHEAEIVLGSGVALLSGEAKPLHRLGIVLLDGFAVGIHLAEGVLGIGAIDDLPAYIFFLCVLE
jgi:hypothetical protein